MSGPKTEALTVGAVQGFGELTKTQPAYSPLPARSGQVCSGCDKPFSAARKVACAWASSLDGVPVRALTCRRCARTAHQLGDLAALLPVARRMREMTAAVDRAGAAQ